MGYFREPCPPDHFADCSRCGETFHEAHMDLPIDRSVPFVCDDCKPPAPHCETCTCYREAD